MSDSSKDDDDDIPWPILAIWSFVFVGCIAYFRSELILPFHFFEFWTTKGNFWEAVLAAWPWYVWGFGIACIDLIISKATFTKNTPFEKFVNGTLVSIWAGVAEEIAFRWLFFLSAIVMLPLVNWLMGGFMGLELIRWIYEYALCPVANFATFGYLEPYLMNGYGWVIGAAVISSNGSFRNGHAYQGKFGIVNSWFFGMYMHWVVFKYGILPAMFIHFLYDFVIYTLIAISSAFLHRRPQSFWS